MRIIKVSLLLMFALFTGLLLSAQKKPAAPVQKFKPPKLQTFLDSYKDSVAVAPGEALRIIALPLKIYDDKKTEYKISSYQFLYRKRVMTEDEQTGKAIPTTSISSDRFKITPLPELWINLIKEQLKPGEEFYFFDVIAKDTQGMVMYAPNLKITIR